MRKEGYPSQLEEFAMPIQGDKPRQAGDSPDEIRPDLARTNASTPASHGHHYSSHRYRVLELLDATAVHLGRQGVKPLRESPEVVASIRARWVARYRVSEEDWGQVMRSIDGYRGPKIRKDAQNLRRFFEAVMWVADTGARWSDLPPFYGQWRRIYVRFVRWSNLEYWRDIVSSLSDGDQKHALALLVGNYYVVQRAQWLISALSGDKVVLSLDDLA